MAAGEQVHFNADADNELAAITRQRDILREQLRRELYLRFTKRPWTSDVRSDDPDMVFVERHIASLLSGGE